MVESVFDGVRLLGDVFAFLAFGNGGGFFEEALFLLSAGFGLVFVEEFECLGGGVAVEHILKLGDCGGDLSKKLVILRTERACLEPEIEN